ncbi:MAG: PAS domain S-box protein [Desulfobacula sp.]|nr:PAS domain S-box protein [Desulfobacula sp.]
MAEKPTYEELERRIQEFQKTEFELKQIKGVLLESEERYRSLIHFSPLPFLVTQEEKIVFVNPAVLNFFGVGDEGEIIGTTPGKWIHPDFIDLGYQRRRRVLETGEMGEPKELVLMGQDAREMTVLANTVRITHNGSPATLSVFQDITELKKIQGKLIESETLFRGMFNNHSAVMLLIDSETGLIINANHAAVQFYGYPLETMREMKIHQLNMSSPAEIEKEMHRALHKEINRFKFRHLMADGQIRHVEVHSTPIEIQNRILLFSIIHDITERKQAEDALRRNEKDLRESQRIAHVGSWRLDAATNQVVWTEELYNMYGFDPSLPPPPYTEHMKLFTPESWERLSTALAHTRETGIPYTLELETVRKDGSNGWLWVQGEAIVDPAGKTVELWGAAQDITERRQANETLRKSDARHGKMVANIGDVIVIIDQNGINRYKSPNIEKIFGWKPEDVVGESTWNNVHPDDIEFTRKFFEKIMRTPDAVATMECRYRCKDGSYKWIEFTGINLFNDPDIQGLLGNYQDITERKRAEKALIEKEALFRGLFDHMTSGSAVYEVRNDGSKGTDYIIREFNRKSLEMEGKKPEEVMGRSLFDLRPNIDDFGLIPVMKKVWETGIPEYYPVRIYQDDRFSNYYENHIFKLPSGEIVTIYNDVTNEKNQQRDLQESEARFKALHNASFGGICIHDKGMILECNQGLSEMTGYSMDELIGMNGLLLIAEKSRPAVMDNIVSGYEKPYEAMGLRKNGEEFPMRLEARNVPYKGKPVRTVEFRDLTGEKQAELEKEKLRAQLLQARKMESVGRLAGGVAHDFNNMLGVILGHTELALERVEENSGIGSDLKEIQTAAQRSADLTKQLLTFARKQIIEPKILNLNPTVKQMINMLQRLIGEDIDLLWKPAKNLWAVKMDPSQIDQILINLCVNARDAIAGVGKLTIETGVVSFDEAYCRDHTGFIPGDFVLLGVSDDGSGMDKETLNNLFEPFFTTKETGKGTGLGLATIYGIVKQNNGFINVYSEPGQGSTFKIYLPRFFDDGRISAVTQTEKPVPGGNETILLVEDEPAVLNLTRMMLERKGYSVLSAATPAEAIDMAASLADKIHLLMTDVVMPGMNGRDLARRLTALYPDIRCLFMSGYTANVIAHQGVLDEGVAFIQKPFSMNNLADKLREVLDIENKGNYGNDCQ